VMRYAIVFNPIVSKAAPMDSQAKRVKDARFIRRRLHTKGSGLPANAASLASALLAPKSGTSIALWGHLFPALPKQGKTA